MKGRPRAVVPPGLLLAWVPSLVVDRLSELHRRYVDRPAVFCRSQVRPGQKPAPAVVGWAEECGITWRNVYASARGLAPAGILRFACVRCPHCRAIRRALYEEEGAWRCSNCRANKHPDRLETRMAEYACGLLIGTHGIGMRRRRETLLRHGAERAAHASRPRDLLLLGYAAGLVAPPLRWPGLTPGMRRWRGASSFSLEARVHLVPAAIDSRLHYRAFLGRYGQRV